MTFTNDELLAILDEVTITFGELLLTHRQLTEGFFEDNQIVRSQDRIEKRREEIEKERDLIRKARDAIRHRREVDQIRKQHEKEQEQGRRRQTEVTRKCTGIKTITNQRGQVVGYRQENGNRTTYLSPKGKVIAREVGGQTYDARGTFVGVGKQGLRLLGQRQK